METPTSDVKMDDKAEDAYLTPVPSQPETAEVVPQEPAKPVKIRYTADCDFIDGPDFFFSQDDKPLILQVSNAPAGTQEDETKPILEIFTNVDVRLAKYPGKDEEGGESDEESKKPTLEGKRITKIRNSRMVIRSAVLSQMIRDAVEYYPSQNLTGETITIHEPYGVLVHHAKELKETMTKLESESSGSEEKDMRLDHLQVLFSFLDPYVQRTSFPAQKRLKQKVPTVTFKDIWYLLQPGLTAYTEWEEEGIGCVISGVRLEEADDDDPLRWEVKIRFVHMSFSGGEIGTVHTTIDIPKYEGEKTVTSLPIFPQKYFDLVDGGERKAKFERRGKKICDILWKGHEYMNYDGEFMAEGKQKYKGQIIVGCTNDTEVLWPKHEWDFSWDDEKPADPKTPEGTSSTSSKVLCKLWLDPSKDNAKSITPKHWFLVCPVISGFALASKTWMPINIDNTRDLDKNQDVPDAIIGPEKLKIIKALSDYQTKSTKPWSADFIKNKGDGIVVLLHGPPGVGKTYTVETTALRAKRPLISLTIAEIGTKEEKVESELSKWFSLAQKWQAILLIDECDIFLERREHADIARNGVVSAFLRKIEYFGGLLFLTTNRVGHIDDAFMSRVHVVVGFDKLDESKRTSIWKSLLEKLQRERKHQIRVSNGARKFLESAEMRAMEWNGREIRNAFQTAIALAEYDARDNPDFEEGEEIIVEAEQFRSVMEMNKTFRSYLDSIRIQDEAERARAHMWRNDFFKK